MAVNINLPIESIAEICRRYGVAELAVFGSATTKRFRQESDVDLLVKFKPETRIGLMGFGRLQDELSDLLGREVDLVSKNGLKEVIRDQVLQEAQIVFEED